MSWEGDTVYRQNRMENYGSWKDNLDAVDATAVIAWFGQIEAFERAADEFKACYAKLLDEFAMRTPRIVILSPTPFERPLNSRVPEQHGAQRTGQTVCGCGALWQRSADMCTSICSTALRR
jgi:hypothetical protein